MPFVLDSSMTMAWCFPDEVTPFTESVLGQLRMTGALVPAIWPLEVLNVLLVAERQSRLMLVAAREFIDDLETLPITIDALERGRVFREVLALGREQNLTAYDAAYLELARREGLPLATLDRDLREAAMRVGVPLVQ